MLNFGGLFFWELHKKWRGDAVDKMQGICLWRAHRDQGGEGMSGMSQVVACVSLVMISSGQIIATSHNLGPQKVAFGKVNPVISGKSGVGDFKDFWNFHP